ncbi:MAG: cysteine--tRNA ligase [Candidatus Lokiarchaeota archaeon]|nr:cysteine--tRNA ligase [Candidatus Lokiarchaeota archaeon]MBD3340769.1 cysteine--tRNA ligase [Candidatus Lokiarchaeota archaeon]
MIRVYNSLTYQEEEFKPINPDKVLMYVCGPTVYDSPHLGHAKSALAFDIIRRYLEFSGYELKIVKNYTDIDDKIIKRANERNMDYKELSEIYIKEYREIMRTLNVKPETENPRATEVIDYMIKIIKGLIEKDHAYESNGSVYFEVKTFPKYKAVLQNISEDELEEEEEEEEESEIIIGDKKDAKDFALWKKSKEGEPSWESPWSDGRPGWHIECSAMALKYLGETIDIHGGGQDLKFPHHRNEIAQSESYTGKSFANYFIHNGFVNIDDEKMSKSLGNFFLVSDVVKKLDPMVVRFFLISSHYRSSVNYNLDTITQAKKNYEKLMNTIRKIYQTKPLNDPIGEYDKDMIKWVEEARLGVLDAMNDDFNTPEAIAEIMSLFRDINRAILEEEKPISEGFKDKFFDFIDDIEKILGIFPKIEKALDLEVAGSFDKRGELIENLVGILKETRSKLRESKIFDLSDDIRSRINNYFIRKELGLGMGGSFDDRGQIILNLIKNFDEIKDNLEESSKADVIEIINEELAKLGIKEAELNLDAAGSFDKRGELINQLIDVYLQIRKKLREKDLYKISDYICESLSEFWIEKELDVETAGSFDKRGQLIDELLEIITDVRTELRKRKIYDVSDFIREELRKLGIDIEDK